MRLDYYKNGFSLKKQILIYFITITLVPVLAVGTYYYYISNNIVKKNIVESNYRLLSTILDNIDRKVEQAAQLTNFTYSDNNIIKLLRSSPENINEFNTIKKQAIESLQINMENTPISNDVLSLFIIGTNGLDIRNGVEAPLIEPKDFMGARWFIDGMNARDTISLGGISLNYTDITRNKYVIPQFRAINDLGTGKYMGYCVILLNETIFSSYFKDISQDNGERIYLTDTEGNILSTNQLIAPELNIRDKLFFEGINRNKGKLYFEEEIDNNMNLVIYKESLKTGLILVETIPMTHMNEYKTLVTKTTIILILSLTLMCMLLSIFLSQYFVKPIQLLVEEVNEIAHGNFDKNISIDANNEIGELGKSVSKMKDDIKSLIQERVEREKAKRIIEIRMLQSQINPHFLYNTLNTVKLMATLQGSIGIERMIECIGRILRATLSNVNEKITLREELSILEDYIHIQKIRYKGKVKVDIDIGDDYLLDCLIIKFILQPILENAILHGIEPKDGTGNIKLSVYSENNQLIIDIWDDGVGMSQIQLECIREHIDIKDIPRDKNGLGLSNVNQRIKLVYGEKYGLDFESQLDKYTRLVILLPIESSARA